MTAPQETGYFTGELLVNDLQDDANHGHGYGQGVVFRTDDFDILFRCAVGGTILFDRDHLQTEGDRVVYYPHFPETVAELDNPWVRDHEYRTVGDEVSMRYYVASGELFVQSQIDPDFGNVHFVLDGNLYGLEGPVPSAANGYDYNTDELLGLGPSEDVVPVRNMSTGFVGPVDRDRMRDILDSDEPIGALPVQDPEVDGRVNKLVRELSPLPDLPDR